MIDDPNKSDQFCRKSRRNGRKKETIKIKIAQIKGALGRLGINRILFMLMAGLITLIPLGIHCYLAGFYRIVFLNGEEIGHVKEEEEVHALVAELLQEKSWDLNMKIYPAGEIEVSEPVFVAGQAGTREQLQEVLIESFPVLAKAYLVKIDEEPVFHLQSDKVLHEITDRLLEMFSVAKNGGKVLETRIAESLDGEWVKVPPEEVLMEDKAFAYLNPLAGTEQERQSLASREASGARYEGDPPQAIIASPGELPSEDEEINNSLLTIVTVEEISVTEETGFNTRRVFNSSLEPGKTQVQKEGIPGLKQVTYRITRKNGQQVNQEKQQEIVVKKAEDQVIEIGPAIISNVVVSQDARSGSGQFIWPVPAAYGGKITRGFGGGHRGIDIYSHALSSTPIIAADSGTVIASFFHSGGYGNVVVILHETAQGNYITVYAHNSRNLVGVGQTVSRGEIIAYMGNTGQTSGRTGIHLHFEIRVGSGEWLRARPLNPLKFF